MTVEAMLPESIQSVPEALAFWAEIAPGHPALIVAGGPVVTYGELWRGARTIAESLAQAGMGREDRVVLLVPEGPALAVALLGVMSAAIAIPLAADSTPAELTAALGDLRPTGVVASPALPEAVWDALVRHGASVFELHPDDLTRGFVGATPSIGPARPLAWPDPGDVAAVSQTSGTTGRPKRAPRMHANFVESGRRHRDRFGLSRHDRALAVAPITLSLGRTALMHGIAAGSSLIFPASPALGDLWAGIETERPTWMHASAGFLELLARWLRERPTPPPSSLRFVRVTAAPIAPEVCDELAARLGARILPGYSTSETGLIATAMPPPAPHKPGSTGKPIQEMRIVDGGGVDVGPNVEGEIWVRGPQVLRGYFDDPALDAAAFTPDGWLRMGDVGYRDEDGFLFLTGRLKELINRGGAKISPAEVDAVLLAHPAVREGAAFAVPDERLGEEIVAAVVAEPDAAPTARELRAWMLDRLAPHKAPRRIWFVDALPRTASGKVLRPELSRRWQEEHGEDGPEASRIDPERARGARVLGGAGA